MSRGRMVEVGDPGWSAFVESRPAATPFHNPGWAGLLADCYGFRTFAFVLAGSDGIEAGVPVAEVRSLSRKKKWVALPFTDALAPLGPPELIGDLTASLDDARREARIGSVEVRAPTPNGSASVRGFTHVLRLRPDSEALLETFSKSQVRRNIARAAREGVTVREAEHEDDLLETFYALHLLTRSRQGVPIQPRRFFSLLWERIIARGLGTVLIAEVGRHVAAAAVFLTWGQTVVYKFGASDPEVLWARPNHAIFWEAIRRACASGMVELDFGRTDPGNDGLRAFKAGWGTDERPLVYTTFGDARTVHGSRALESVLSATIRHSPRWVCRAVGETLYRYAG
ncbi:MAG: GNAT family N-acetyltransferase [Actinobacteria bacterium]|nr:GNAT family N-acetyltransferase [Actinomycetota bacterium]